MAVILNKNMAKSLKGYWPISGRVLLLKLSGTAFDIVIIQIYAPIAESTEEEIQEFYEQLDEAKSRCKFRDIVFVQGDFNAKVGSERFEDIVGDCG